MTDILEEPKDGHELFVYLGSATDSKGKSHSLWISAPELDKDAGAADYEAVRRAAGWYNSKGDAHRPIGGLYSIKCQREGERCSIWFGTAKYTGQSAHPLIAVFQAKDAEARDMAYRAKNERKAQEPVYMRDMERTVEALKGLPRRQALDIVNAIGIELRTRVLSAK